MDTLSTKPPIRKRFRWRPALWSLALLLVMAAVACSYERKDHPQLFARSLLYAKAYAQNLHLSSMHLRGNSPAHLSPFQKAVVGDLARQVRANIRYQDGYFQGGDPPPNIGVCTDVVIRSYRAAGVNLQQLVAQDIATHPGAYHITRPDPNIDHRRCKNLALFFRRNAIALPTSGPHAGWRPADIVFWDTSGNNGVPDHVGVISDHVDTAGVPTVVHHWPGQPVAEADWLYQLPVVYHFRWPTHRRL